MSMLDKWDTPAARFGLAILAMIIGAELISVIGQTFFPMAIVAQPGIAIGQPGASVGPPGISIGQPGISIGQPDISNGPPGIPN